MRRYKITALTVQKRNRQRVNVQLDGEFAFGLSRIVAAWLEVGQEIDDQKIAQLRAEDEREVAHQKALQYIQYRPRSEGEVRQHLRQGNVAEETIEQVVARLKESGLINDLDFARIWVENRADFRPRSQRALAQELRRHGIDAETAAQAVHSIDDTQMAYNLAARRAPKLAGLNRLEFHQKLHRYLAARGFDYAISKGVIEQVWSEKHNPEDEAEE